MIVFTRREIERAWRNNLSAYESAFVKTNPHRLMLFYAVECGLKASIMKRELKNITDSTITELSHNINKLLDKLKISYLDLPEQIRLQKIKGEQQRVCQVDEINQMWRYGHLFSPKQATIDQDLEDKLLKIVEWIKQELTGV